MEFRILGPLEVVDDGRAVDLGGPKQRALLALLLLHANEVVSPDVLADALWEGQPPPAAAKTLQAYVSRLRKALGRDVLETRGHGYLLRVAQGELDAPTWRMSPSRRRRSGIWRSFGSPRTKSGSRPSLRSVATPTS